MAWKIEFTPAARKCLRDIDRAAAQRIVRFLQDRVSTRDNPRQLGEALVGKKYTGVWKYRVGDYRILAEIKDTALIILVVEVGNRREIYR